MKSEQPKWAVIAISDQAQSSSETEFSSLLFAFRQGPPISEEEETLPIWNKTQSQNEDESQQTEPGSEESTAQSHHTGLNDSSISTQDIRLIAPSQNRLSSHHFIPTRHQSPAIQPETIDTIPTQLFHTERMIPSLSPQQVPPLAFAGRIQEKSQGHKDLPFTPSIATDPSLTKNPLRPTAPTAIRLQFPIDSQSIDQLPETPLPQRIRIDEAGQDALPQGDIETASTDSFTESSQPLLEQKLSLPSSSSFLSDKTRMTQSELQEAITSRSVQKIETLLENIQPVPSRQIGIRITPQGEGSSSNVDVKPVDLYLQQRGNAIHFSVHTTDHSLAVEMKSSLRDLSARLNHNAYQADLWSSSPDMQPVLSTSRLTEHDTAFNSRHDNDAAQRDSYNESTGDHPPDDQESSSQERWFTQWEKEIFAPLHTSRKEFK